MTGENYELALADAQAQLANAIAERDQWNVRVIQLQAAIRVLSNLLGQQMQAEAGLTDAVRAVLHNAQGQWVTAALVRDRLIQWGYDLSGYKNPLGFIHTILQRLVQSGEVVLGPTRRPFSFRFGPRRP